MTTIFEKETATATEGKRSLPGAAVLKNAAYNIAANIMAQVETGDEAIIAAVAEAQKSTSALDDLVKSQAGDSLINEDIKDLDEDTVKKLLKSNQSNRSRRKSMPMTKANFTDMLTSAVAEWIIRTTFDIDKSAGGFGGVQRDAVEITPEVIAELAEDQERLGRAIRNVQSKKSILKKKNPDDFETTEEWAKLLEDEAALKNVRVAGAGNGGRKGVSLKKFIAYLFGDIEDFSSVKKDECVALLESISNAAAGKYPDAYLEYTEAQLEDAEAAAEQEAADQAGTDGEVYAD
jgi:hypothetical protein